MNISLSVSENWQEWYAYAQEGSFVVVIRMIIFEYSWQKIRRKNSSTVETQCLFCDLLKKRFMINVMVRFIYFYRAVEIILLLKENNIPSRVQRYLRGMHLLFTYISTLLCTKGKENEIYQVNSYILLNIFATIDYLEVRSSLLKIQGAFQVSKSILFWGAGRWRWK